MLIREIRGLNGFLGISNSGLWLLGPVVVIAGQLDVAGLRSGFGQDTAREKRQGQGGYRAQG